MPYFLINSANSASVMSAYRQAQFTAFVSLYAVPENAGRFAHF